MNIINNNNNNNNNIKMKKQETLFSHLSLSSSSQRIFKTMSKNYSHHHSINNSNKMKNIHKHSFYYHAKSCNYYYCYEKKLNHQSQSHYNRHHQHLQNHLDHKISVLSLTSSRLSFDFLCFLLLLLKLSVCDALLSTDNYQHQQPLRYFYSDHLKQQSIQTSLRPEEQKRMEIDLLNVFGLDHKPSPKYRHGRKYFS